MDEILRFSPAEQTLVAELRHELTDAEVFLRERLATTPDGDIRWSKASAPPPGVSATGIASVDVVRARCDLVRRALAALAWSEAQRCRTVETFNIMAHRPRRAGGGGHHVVLRRHRKTVRIELSTYTGETLFRSEVERLLRRLEVPRSNEEREWPSGRLVIVVPRKIAEHLLSKDRPRRCAYWVLAQIDDEYVFEVLPIIGPTDVSDGDAIVPVPFVHDPQLVAALRDAGATVGGKDGDARISWNGVPGTEGLSSVCPQLDLEQWQLSPVPPDDWLSECGWDEYWRYRALSPDVGRDLLPFLDAVMLRYLFRQARPEIDGRAARILCVANGISQLPNALCAAGFCVTVLERSAVAADIGRRSSPPVEQLTRFFDLAAEEIDAASTETFLRPDGSIEWVDGDLFDNDAAPGPHDIIITTRFLEGLSDFDLRVAAARIDARLSPDGWCWVAIQNSGFKWIAAQREFRSLGYAVVPYDDLPATGKAMSGGLTSG